MTRIVCVPSPSLPRRHGLPWPHEEILAVCYLIERGDPIALLAERYQRTSLAIWTRYVRETEGDVAAAAAYRTGVVPVSLGGRYHDVEGGAA